MGGNEKKIVSVMASVLKRIYYNDYDNVAHKMMAHME